MDDNTAKVLMALIALISAIVTPIVVVWVSMIQARKIKDMGTKVEDYHKEVNGKMGLLLETTKELATSQEKARAEGEKNIKKTGL